MKVFVTGAAGFIGSNLVDGLLAEDHSVVGWDNMSTGCDEFLASARSSRRFELFRGDLADLAGMAKAMIGTDLVCHLAANADVRFGTSHPELDLRSNTIGTFNVLEAMRESGVRRIIFSSTGSVYGEPDVFPTPESAPFPIQTSLYGASKLAGEALISAYATGFGLEAVALRFVSILGERYTHGHVFDFCRALRNDPDRLEILGDGHQRKSYLHVKDCVTAILAISERMSKRPSEFEVFNLGTDSFCEVNDSVAWICSELNAAPKLLYTGGKRGWVGDSPFIFLNCSRIRELGWEPQHGIQESVRATVRWLQANTWVYERRR